MSDKNCIEEIQDNIPYKRSCLDNISWTSLNDGGLEILEQRIDDIMFYEDKIEEDLEDLGILEKEDPSVLRFFDLNTLEDG